MKDNRFIELVNLYVDRQITAEEMEMLEAELQANARRRATYRQYCQMNRATTLVYESFRTGDADDTSEAVTGGARISRFEPGARRRRTPWLYYSCGLAAACVALVFARVNYSDSPVGQNFAKPTLLSHKVAAVQAPIAEAPTEKVAQHPAAISMRSNALVAEQDYAAMLAAMRREEQRAFASGEIQPSRAPSLFEDGVFDSQTASGARTFRSKQSSSSPAEFAAFQFQR